MAHIGQLLGKDIVSSNVFGELKHHIWTDLLNS